MSVTTRPEPRTGTEQATRTLSWSGARLVAEREIREAVRAKGFWITFGLFAAGILALAVLPGLFGGPSSVAAVGDDTAAMAEAAELEVQDAADAQAATELVRSGEVDAAIVPDPSADAPTGVRIVAETQAPDDVLAVFSVSPPVDLLEPAEVSGAVRYLVTFALGLVYFMFALMFGMGIAQSVVSEKQTRIVEILVATIPVRALLAGKIVGNSLLALSQVAALALVTPIALRIGGQGEVLSLLGGALGWFVPFFVFGFVLLASMWAVAGSLVSRQEDLGSSTTLVSMLAMFPYFAVIVFHTNPTAMAVLSYVPFSSTVAMPARMFTGEAQTWEPFVALVLLVAVTVVTILGASRIYAGSLLKSGGKVALTKAWAQTDEERSLSE